MSTKASMQISVKAPIHPGYLEVDQVELEEVDLFFVIFSSEDAFWIRGETSSIHQDNVSPPLSPSCFLQRGVLVWGFELPHRGL